MTPKSFTFVFHSLLCVNRALDIIFEMTNLYKREFCHQWMFYWEYFCHSLTACDYVVNSIDNDESLCDFKL